MRRFPRPSTGRSTLEWKRTTSENVICRSSVACAPQEGSFGVRRWPSSTGSGSEIGLTEFRKRICQLPRRRGANPMFEDLHRHALLYLNCLSESEVCRVLRFLAASGGVSDKSVIARYCERMQLCEPGKFSVSDISMAMNALVRMNYTDRLVFDMFSDYFKAYDHRRVISEKDLGLTCNAFCRAGYKDDLLFDKLCICAESHSETISSRSAANICHAIGKLRIKTPQTTKTVISMARRVIDNEALSRTAATPQELANMVYALGNLELIDSVILPDIIAIVARRMSDFNPIETSAIATALSKLKYSEKHIMKALSKHVQSQQAQYSLFEITAVLNAFSHLNVPVPRALFNLVTPDIAERESGRTMDSTTACILVCAYARSKVSIPASFRERVYAAALKERQPQYLVNVLFALGQTGAPPEGMPDVLIEALGELESELPVDCVSLTQLIYALNKLDKEWHNHSIYKRSLAVALIHALEFDGNQICNILHSIANRVSPPTVGELELINVLRKSSKLTTLTPQLHSSLTEALTILDMH